MDLYRHTVNWTPNQKDLIRVFFPNFQGLICTVADIWWFRFNFSYWHWWWTDVRPKLFFFPGVTGLQLSFCTTECGLRHRGCLITTREPWTRAVWHNVGNDWRWHEHCRPLSELLGTWSRLQGQKFFREIAWSQTDAVVRGDIWNCQRQ